MTRLSRAFQARKHNHVRSDTWTHNNKLKYRFAIGFRWNQFGELAFSLNDAGFMNQIVHGLTHGPYIPVLLQHTFYTVDVSLTNQISI